MITTGIGLASLWSSDFEILQGVGKIGVQALVAIFALTFLPAFIYSQFLKDSNTNATTIAKAVISKDSRLLRFTKSHCRTLVCITPFFLGTFYFWNQHISSDMRTREFLDKSSQTRIAMDLMDEHMGGINIFQVSVKASKPRGIQEYEVIRYLHDLRNKALEIPGVQNAYTYSQFFTTIHQLFLGDNFSNGNVLPNQAQSQIYTQLLNSQSFPFQNVIENEDKSSTVFFLRCQDIRSTDFLHIVEKFIEVSAENKPQDLEIIINNGIHSILASDRKIVNSQMNSILWSLASIFICLALLWRKPLFAIIVILTNSLPIVAIASCLYLLNIPLNSITVMVAPVILGIAVDDAIHFLTYYQKRVNFGLSRELALKETLAKKIRPIICTSLILASSFLMFIVAPFPPLRHFGILGCIALLTALISTLFLIPAFLQFFEKYQRTQNNETET
jgi:uncharacterized protein